MRCDVAATTMSLKYESCRVHIDLDASPLRLSNQRRCVLRVFINVLEGVSRALDDEAGDGERSAIEQSAHDKFIANKSFSIIPHTFYIRL